MKKSQIQDAKSYMDTLKMEISSELGVSSISNKGNRTARENGRVGGQMTKMLVELGKQHINELN